MGTTSAAAKRRWRKKSERQRMSRIVKTSLARRRKPTTAFGLLPAQAIRLKHSLKRQAIDLLTFVPHPISIRGDAWLITATGGAADSYERFLNCLYRAGLRSLRFSPEPILNGRGWAINCIAVPKGQW